MTSQVQLACIKCAASQEALTCANITTESGTLTSTSQLHNAATACVPASGLRLSSFYPVRRQAHVQSVQADFNDLSLDKEDDATRAKHTSKKQRQSSHSCDALRSLTTQNSSTQLRWPLGAPTRSSESPLYKRSKHTHANTSKTNVQLPQKQGTRWPAQLVR